MLPFSGMAQLWARTMTCAAAAVAFGAVAAAETRIVAVDTVDGLTRAVEAAQAGDEIVLAPGTYVLDRLNLKAAGTAENPITLKASRRGQAVIHATARETFVVYGAHWIVDGLDILGICEPQELCDHAFHIVGQADNFILRDNRIRDFNAAIKGNGLELETAGAGGQKGKEYFYPDNVLIAGNFFYNATPRTTDVPVTVIDVVGGDGWIIRENFVADFQKGGGDGVSYGMFLKGNSRNGVFERNLVICEWQHAGGSRVAMSLGGGGTGTKFCENQDCTYEHTNGLIRNNIILNCSRDVGIYLNKARDTKIYNNTLINTAGIDIRFQGSTADIRNNIVSGLIRDRNGGDHTEANNLVHPHSGSLMDLYADVATGNFRLRREGEIMGKGRRLPEVTDDFCGRPRRLAVYDLGAIEYGPGRCGTTRMLRDAVNFGK